MATARGGGLPACGFLVTMEKAGQLPLSIERRAKGKRVTVISGVRGNARALCTALTTLLGVGGTTHPRGPLQADVEVQGEQQDRVAQALAQLGCLRGPGGKPPPAVAERDCGYDEFLKRDVPTSSDRKPRTVASAPPVELPEPPADAPCAKWHGYWIYCQGACTPVDLSNIWLETSFELLASDREALGIFCVTSTEGRSQLDAALGRLGMTAEVGEAIARYHRERREAELELRRRQNAPQVSLCAQRPRSAASGAEPLTCELCGATFSMKKTLELHRRQHQRDTTEAPSASAVFSSWVPPATPARWTGDSLVGYGESPSEEVAAKAWAAWAEWAAENGKNQEDDIEPEAAAHMAKGQGATSLGSWIDAAISKSSRPQQPRRTATETKPAPKSAQDYLTPCPVCGRRFFATEMDRHVDLCLSSSPSSRAAASGAAPQEDADVLPAELLESLLDMELSPEATDRFWASYEELAWEEGATARDAFLRALEETLQLPGALGDPVGRGRSASSSSSRPAQAPSKSGDDTAQCPVCGVGMPVQAIDVHVEECLQRAAAEEAAAAAEEAEAQRQLQEALAEIEAQESRKREEEEEKRRQAEARKKAHEECVKVLAKAEEAEKSAAQVQSGETAQQRIARIKAEAKARLQNAKSKPS